MDLFFEEIRANLTTYYMQKTHENTINKNPQVKISVLAPDLDLNDNIGGLFRICDAMGVQSIYFGNNIDLQSRKLKKAARSTQNYITCYTEVDCKKLINESMYNNVQIVGLELTNSSVPIHKLELNKNHQILIVIGNEVEGISESLLSEIPQCYHIDMYGRNSSMNVIQATSIALYYIQHSSIVKKN